MEVLVKPEFAQQQMGNKLKVVGIKGMAGTRMPHYYCTNEVVIVVKEGLALLTMPDSEYLLDKGGSFIIPAEKEHTLKIKKDFKAVAIMAVDSEINFI